MSEIRQYLTLLGVLQMVGAAALFAALLALLRSPQTSAVRPRTWYVFRKHTKLLALSAYEEDPSAWSGFTFAVFFYYALPLWWWQWGLQRTIVLIALPLAAAVLLGNVAVAPLFSSPSAPLDAAQRMLVTAATLIPMRVLAGFYVRKHHRRFRRAALEDRGWVLCGTVEAGSASGAKASFAAPSKVRRFVASVRKVFNKNRSASRSDA